MRPVRLELQGFGAFREPTVVDLDGADLFAIVGATGHGKSTLIDAICFALYGKVPRHGERDIAPVVTLGANEAKVSFTFALGGGHYVATRILKRDDKGAKTRAVRLERLGDDGSSDVIAGAVREFQTAVVALVGLDFDQFTKCVVLPQGRFAEFLHAPAGERTAILSALLDLGRYDRMATAARDRSREAGGRRAAYEQERARLSDVTHDSLASARARHAALEELGRALAEAMPVDARLAHEIETARTNRDAARRAEAALAGVRVPPQIHELARSLNDATTRLDAANEQADAADAHAAALDAELAMLPAVEVLAAAAEAHRDREGLLVRLATGDDVLAQRRAELARAQQTRTAAEEAAAEAQSRLDDAQRRHAHAELRAELVVGEPCPVCEQAVAALPKPVRTTELAKARKALGGARKTLQHATAGLERALAEVHQAEAQHASLRERLAEAEARTSVFPDAAELATKLEAASSLAHAIADARANAAELRRVAKTTAGELDAMRDRVRQADDTLRAVRDQLVSAGVAPPPLTDADLGRRWDDLAAWAGDARPEHQKRAAELDDRVGAHSAERDVLIADLATRTRGVGVPVGSVLTVADLVPVVTAAERDSAHNLRRVEEALARADELEATIAAEHDREQVAGDLGRLLDKRHFGQWLVDEALRGLVAGASAILERLSAGQYALAAADDGELLVVDHANADETRSVRSLSGGETFQASLALALALADRIAELAVEGAAALESIFLDEGFGTLDPETLDVVAGTIESLAHHERVVGIVTHVAELAERMPTRLRVRKEGRTAVVSREDG